MYHFPKSPRKFHVIYRSFNIQFGVLDFTKLKRICFEDLEDGCKMLLLYCSTTNKSSFFNIVSKIKTFLLYFRRFLAVKN